MSRKAELLTDIETRGASSAGDGPAAARVSTGTTCLGDGYDASWQAKGQDDNHDKGGDATPG